MRLLICIFAIIFICIFMNSVKNNLKMRHSNSPPMIFICVHSYRNTNCISVLETIFENAKYPDLLTVCVIQHYDPHEEFDCVLDSKYKHRIHVERYHYMKSFGRYFACNLSTKYINKEMFYLSISSSAHLVNNWDVLLHDQWKLCNNTKAILSTYLKPYELNDVKRRSNYYLKMKRPAKIIKDHIPIPEIVYSKKQKIPQTIYSINSDFVFIPIHAIKKVKFDPMIKNLRPKFGTDMYWSVQLWDKGYAFFSPQVDIAYKHNIYKKKFNIEDFMIIKKRIIQDEIHRIKLQLSLDYNPLIANTVQIDDYKINKSRANYFMYKRVI